MEIFYLILSILHSIVTNMNDVMLYMNICSPTILFVPCTTDPHIYGTVGQWPHHNHVVRCMFNIVYRNQLHVVNSIDFIFFTFLCYCTWAISTLKSLVLTIFFKTYITTSQFCSNNQLGMTMNESTIIKQTYNLVLKWVNIHNTYQWGQQTRGGRE